MHYLLIDKNPRLVSAWREQLGEFSNIKILEGDITNVSCDAIVSPANSFGFMDGGLGYAISERLGWDLQTEVQQFIKNLPEGELLVGKAEVFATQDELIPYLIVAPTMRVPTNFQIPTSINAYLAMKAILIAAKKHEAIEYVAIPGLCTGVGRMQPEICARQMLYAYQEIGLGEKQDFDNFGDAQKYHWNINPQGQIWAF
jgi:O-acetyl-ADP-ribose deacetylase (regulator of RNase III)